MKIRGLLLAVVCLSLQAQVAQNVVKYGPPIGPCSGTATYTDISPATPVVYTCAGSDGHTWVPIGGGGGGGATLPSSGVVVATSPSTSRQGTAADITALIGTGSTAVTTLGFGSAALSASTAFDASGAAASAQAASDPLGSASTAQTNAQTFASNASNLSSGTVSSGLLPTGIPSSKLTPPGSSGQVILNTSGLFGAATVSGDGTLSGTGALLVTKTNSVAFAPSATTDTTNATNIASGTLNDARLPSTSNNATVSAISTQASTTATNTAGISNSGGFTLFSNPTQQSGTFNGANDLGYVGAITPPPAVNSYGWIANQAQTGNPYRIGFPAAEPTGIMKGVLFTNPVNITGTTNTSNTTISSVSSTTLLQPGQPISGSGIPANTKIVNTPTSATPSAAGTITVSNQPTAAATVTLTVVNDEIRITPAVAGNSTGGDYFPPASVVAITPDQEVQVNPANLSSGTLLNPGLNFYTRSTTGDVFHLGYVNTNLSAYTVNAATATGSLIHMIPNGYTEKWCRANPLGASTYSNVLSTIAPVCTQDINPGSGMYFYSQATATAANATSPSVSMNFLGSNYGTAPCAGTWSILSRQNANSTVSGAEIQIKGTSAPCTGQTGFKDMALLNDSGIGYTFYLTNTAATVKLDNQDITAARTQELSDQSGSFIMGNPTGGATPPAIAVGAAAGTSPGTPTLTGTNNSGVITVITGTATTTGTLATITFQGTTTRTPQGCALMPHNSQAAAASVYTPNPSSTTWTINVGTALTVSATYSWSFICL